MNELRSVLPRQLRRLLVGGALGCLVHLQVMALDNMPTRLDKFNTWSNGNVVSTRYAHDAAVGAIRHAQRSSVTGTSVAGGVNLSKQIAVNTTNGVVSMTATQRIGARQIAKGLRAAAGGPLGLALLAATAVAELYEEAGLQPQPDGSVLMEVNTYGYRRSGTQPNGQLWPVRSTILLVCHDIMASTIATNGFLRSVTGTHPTYEDISIGCAWSANPGGNTYGAVRITNVGTQPATEQQIEDALTNANPSPEVLRDLVQIGDVVPAADPADQIAITSPQPSPTKTTTKTNPDGSTETTTCGTIGLLEGLDIRLIEECTVTARDPSGNVTSTTSTTTDQADPKPQEEEEQSMFCELFPNVLACVELGDPEGDEIPREERSVSFSPEVLFGSGSCPADVTITSQGMTVTVARWSSWCPYITTYMRPMVLLLAAFAALMIVLRGVDE